MSESSIVAIVVSFIGGASVVMQGINLRRQKASELKRQDGQERMTIILRGIEACLRGVQELGADGAVTEALDALSEYKNKKSSK